MNPPARYRVVHETRYTYGEPVRQSRQICHLRPRALPAQRSIEYNLIIDPEPDSLKEAQDAFGNPITTAYFDRSHGKLSVRAEHLVEVGFRPGPEEGGSPPWEEVRERLAYRAGRPPKPEDLEATRYLFESPKVRNKREIGAWAADCFPPDRPILAGVRALADRIFSELAFDPGSTTVSTPVTDVLAKRRGVCQDFAHLMIACLRSLGLSARYVSGYLLTHPPPGRPRLLGADASHAWVSVYAGDLGFIDVDPTNAMFAGQEHITLAWGRDYGDVPPLRGVLLGGGWHTVQIAVTVAPEAEFEALIARER